MERTEQPVSLPQCVASGTHSAAQPPFLAAASSPTEAATCVQQYGIVWYGMALEVGTP